MKTLNPSMLLSVVHETAARRDDSARASLTRLVNEQLGSDTADLRFCFFAQALSKRLASEKTAEINLYLRRWHNPQISLFNLLTQKLPVVQQAVSVANVLLTRFLGSHDEVTLLDVGIGSGRQEVALLRQLAAQGCLPKRLNVVAVEPDAESLVVAQQALEDVGVELGVRLRFVPVQGVLEEMRDADWALAASLGMPLVVNASFVAHHIRCEEGDPLRDQVFQRIRALNPDAIVLSEPNVNHHAASLVERFQNAWHHFGLIFELIDELDVTAQEAASMKLFFQREIDDIVGNGEHVRCERHEPVEVWVDRLRRTGFTPYSDFEFARALRAECIQITPDDGYVGLDYRAETMVAVICAT